MAADIRRVVASTTLVTILQKISLKRDSRIEFDVSKEEEEI
jgi:hypothetical protein